MLISCRGLDSADWLAGIPATGPLTVTLLFVTVVAIVGSG